MTGESAKEAVQAYVAARKREEELIPVADPVPVDALVIRMTVELNGEVIGISTMIPEYGPAQSWSDRHFGYMHAAENAIRQIREAMNEQEWGTK